MEVTQSWDKGFEMNGVKLLPKLKAAFILALGVIGFVPVSASATPITVTYNFDFTNFYEVSGSLPAPYPTVTVEAVVTFDPSTPYPGSIGSVTSLTTNLPSSYTGPWYWTFSPVSLGSSLDIFYISNQCVAGTSNSYAQCAEVYPGTNGFSIALEFTNPLSPTFEAITYTSTISPTETWNESINLADVPEPMTFSLLITGIIGIGMTRVRRSQRIGGGFDRQPDDWSAARG
jgi:hypothetical protein